MNLAIRMRNNRNIYSFLIVEIASKKSKHALQKVSFYIQKICSPENKETTKLYYAIRFNMLRRDYEIQKNAHCRYSPIYISHFV